MYYAILRRVKKIADVEPSADFLRSPVFDPLSPEDAVVFESGFKLPTLGALMCCS